MSRIPPDMYRMVQVFNNTVVGPEVDRTALGLNEPPEAALELGLTLLLEEVDEMVRALGYLSVAIAAPDFSLVPGHRRHPVRHPEALDAACDIVYVLFGLMQRLGVSADMFYAAFYEVTRANMAKAGGPLREDGKRLKPEGWTPPDLGAIIRAYSVQPGPEVGPL